jgi:hypothetical protein
MAVLWTLTRRQMVGIPAHVSNSSSRFSRRRQKSPEMAEGPEYKIAAD